MKKYKFDYLENNVKQWSDDIKKNMTKQMLFNLPYYITFWSELDLENHKYINYTFDFYNNVIDDIDNWKKQRDNFINKLYLKYKKI